MIYCPHCMKQNEEEDTYCKYCKKELHIVNDSAALAVGTMIANRYYIGKMIRKGGFGITYVGCDVRLNKIVAIKEYFPSAFASRDGKDSQYVTITEMKSSDLFEKEKKKFISEAYTLAEFAGERSIVSVTDIISENDTVYLVMEFVEGIDLDQYIKTKSKMTFVNAYNMLHPIINSMGRVHKKGLIHRDITPANIKVQPDGTAVLLDFGAARVFDGAGAEEMSVILKPGYAPAEQYQSHGAQGPWTDVYGVCATMYKMITGITPVNAIDRMMEDRLVRPTSMGAEISTAQEEVLLRGLAVDKANRIQTMEELSLQLQRVVTDPGLLSSANQAYEENEETVLLTDGAMVNADGNTGNTGYSGNTNYGGNIGYGGNTNYGVNTNYGGNTGYGVNTGYAGNTGNLPANVNNYEGNKKINPIKMMIAGAACVGVALLLVFGVMSAGGKGNTDEDTASKETVAKEEAEEKESDEEIEDAEKEEESLKSLPLVLEGSAVLIAGDTSCYYISDGEQPFDVSSYDTKTKWEVSDESIATIQDGVLTGLSEGLVVVKAEIRDKKLEKEVHITTVADTSMVDLLVEPSEIIIPASLSEETLYQSKVYLQKHEEENEERFMMDFYLSDNIYNSVDVEWGAAFNAGVNVEVTAHEPKEGTITLYVWKENDPNMILSVARINVLVQ